VSTEDGDGNGRTINPIECTVDEDFSVKITDGEVELLKDEKGEIRYEKVFQWCLPRYGEDNDESLSEFQAARMRNYMRKRVVEEDYKLRYYTGGKVITGDHVARFYGACRGRILNRIPVTAPILAPILGSLFLKGHISLKNRTYCPLFRNDTTSFKYTCFLISKKEAKIALYGRHLHC
jgi:hypothetical protein